MLRFHLIFDVEREAQNREDANRIVEEEDDYILCEETLRKESSTGQK